MIKSEQKTLSGSEESLTISTNRRSSNITIQAASTNAAAVLLGESGSAVFELSPGQSISFDRLGTEGETILESDDIFVNGDSGDMLNIIWEA